MTETAAIRNSFHRLHEQLDLEEAESTLNGILAEMRSLGMSENDAAPEAVSTLHESLVQSNRLIVAAERAFEAWRDARTGTGPR